MKIVEVVLGVFSIIGLIMLSMHLDGSALLTAGSMLPLALLYLIFGFGLLNNIDLKVIFRSTSFKEFSTTRIIGSIAYGFALSASVIAIFFKVNQLPGANLMLNISLMNLLIGLIIATIRYLPKGNLKPYYPLLIRAIVWCVPVIWLIIR